MNELDEVSASAKLAVRCYIFVPCHNRQELTSSFIRHLCQQIPGWIPYEVILIDDGCTDSTVQLVLAECPATHIIRLDGSALWGGSLNAVRQYVIDNLLSIGEDSLILVCNDDIRFLNRAFEIGYRAIGSECDVCLAARIRTDISTILNRDTDIELDEILIEHGRNYEARTNSFSTSLEYGPVNTGPTFAMFSKVAPWLTVKPIPHDIPHYLSDHWLTYSFFRNGFALRTQPGFIICESPSLSRNNTSLSIEKISASFMSNLYAKLFQWQLGFDRKSPAYAFAHYRFRASFSTESMLGMRLIISRVKIVARLVIVSSLNRFLYRLGYNK